jgi:hypothetical protein
MLCSDFMIFIVKKKTFYGIILRMVDFGEGTGGKGVFNKGMQYFRLKKPLKVEGRKTFFKHLGLTLQFSKSLCLVDKFKS